MKASIFFAVICLFASVYAKDYGGDYGDKDDYNYDDKDDYNYGDKDDYNYDDKDDYNYDDEENLEATLLCTADTDVGDALVGALDTCFGDRSSGRMKPFSTMMKNRKDDECYAFDDIMAWVMKEYGDDACVLQAIGWMDENYALVEEKIGADVMSLPEDVSTPILEGHEKCTKEALNYMDEATSHCEGFYTEDEVVILTDTAKTIAKYECFLHLFEEGCMDFLGNESEEK